MKKNLVAILAGGSGSRIDKQLPKQFFCIAGKPILAHTIQVFESYRNIHDIFIVTNPEFRQRTEAIVKEGGYTKVKHILDGGAVRQESSRIAVEAADPGIYENILIHDAARPFVSQEIIQNILEKLQQYDAVNVAVPSSDTIIEIGDDHLIKRVPERKYLRRVQTPQGFKLVTIRKAHNLALEHDVINATDDCSLILKFNLSPIYVVEGSPKNIKITYPQDIKLAESFFINPTNGDGGESR